MKPEETDWDVALSFAGRDRPFVELVANHLRSARIRCFYDNEPTTQTLLWGKNLAEFLTILYESRSTCCVMFVSEAYRDREWTNLERRAAITRAMRSRSEYVLPVRVDDAEIPGVLSSVGYLSTENNSPADIANHIIRKVEMLAPAHRSPAATSYLHSEKWYPLAGVVAKGLSGLRCQVHGLSVRAKFCSYDSSVDRDQGIFIVSACCREAVENAVAVVVCMGIGESLEWSFQDHHFWQVDAGSNRNSEGIDSVPNPFL